ncbi:MAG TPA: hypothetical protein DC057_04475, partial [Spirochaetia bacterium]|nr:hypothetical protein [Spirochaetia bacterium]
LIKKFNNLTTDDIKSIENAVDSNPLFKGRLISDDKKSTVVMANVSTDITLDELKFKSLIDATFETVRDLNKEYPNISIHITGFSTAKAKIAEFMTQDLKKLFPVALLIVIIMLGIIMRNFKGVLMPVLVTIFAIIWTFSLKGLFRVPVTIVEITIPVMLIAIGCADGVHIVTEFKHFLAKGLDAKAAIKKTMSNLTLPIILTSVTTAIGFFSLISAPGVSIKNMGIFLGFGVMIAMLFSLVFIPAVLSFSRTGKSVVTIKDAGSYGEKIVGKATDVIFKRKYLILVSVVVLLSVSVIGVLNVKVDNDVVKYFHKNDDFRIATEHVNKTMGGISNLFIVLETNEEDRMKDPEVLQAVEKLQTYLEKAEHISFTYGLTDYIKYLNFVIHDNDDDFYRIPDLVETVSFTGFENIDGNEVKVLKTEKVPGKNQVANLIFLYEMDGGDALKSLVTPYYSKLCIHVRIDDSGNEALLKTVRYIEEYLKNNPFADDVKVRFSNHFVRVIFGKIIIDSQIISLATTLIAVTIVLSLLFRSFITGLLVVLPTFTAVMFNFTVMWLANVKLDMGTSIIASIGIGVGVDYGIHFYQRFKLSFIELGDYFPAVKEALLTCYKPVLSNAFSVAAGFAVLSLSSFNIIFNLGWIVSLSMLTTAFAALIILPAMILIVKPVVVVKKNNCMRL